MSCQVSQFKLGVRDVFFGTAKPQKNCILTKADVAGSLNNKFFVIHNNDQAKTKNVFWYNVNAAGTAPTGFPASTVLHEVELATNATAGAVATATRAVINALAWINADISAADATHIETVHVTNGETFFARDAIRAGAETGFSFVNVQQGRVHRNLGVTNGDTTLSVELDELLITSPQTGAYPLSAIRRGMTATASFELKDTSQSSFLRVVDMDGSSYVTDDADARIIMGYGEKKLFTSSDDVADTLSFKDPSGDANSDIHLVKAKLKLGELTFSAENEFVLPIEADGFLDQSLGKSANFLMIGDLSKIKTV